MKLGITTRCVKQEILNTPLTALKASAIFALAGMFKKSGAANDVWPTIRDFGPTGTLIRDQENFSSARAVCTHVFLTKLLSHCSKIGVKFLRAIPLNNSSKSSRSIFRSSVARFILEP